MYDLKTVIEKYTTDEGVDYEKVMATLDNDYVNPIVAKKTDKSKLLPEAVAEVIKGLGIEGETLDDVKLYIKQIGGSTDEAKEEVIKLTTELNKIKKTYEAEVETRTKLENDVKDKHQTDLVKGLGITDEKQVEFFKWDFNRQVTEDKSFDDVVAEYVKNNDVKTTTRFIKDDFGSSGTKELDIGAAWKAQRQHTRK